MSTILFEEKQQFRQWWLWLIMLLIVGDAIWQFIQVIENPAHATFSEVAAPGIIAALPLIIVFFIKSLTLHTMITNEGVYVRFGPIQKKFRFYPWEDIATLHIRKYAPISEYGGWGIRGWGSNKAYNTSGDTGLQLKFKNGNKLLIGTQQPSVLREALSQIKNVPFAPEYSN
jgi:hypothetical protein